MNEEKKNEKSILVNFVFILCGPVNFIGGIALLLFGIFSEYGGLGFALIGIFCTLVGGFFSFIFIDEALRKVKSKKAAKKDKAKMLEDMKDGNWKFPCIEFYEKCKENKIENIKDSFYLKKAEKVAIELLNEKDVPERLHSNLINEEKIIEYWDRAESEIQKQELEKKKEQERARVTPVYAELSSEQKARKKFEAGARNLYGIDKRAYCMSNEIDVINKKIKEKKDEAKQLEKTVDTAWKLINTEVEKRYIFRVKGSIGDIYRSAETLEKEKEQIETEKKELRNKIVLDDIDAEELKKALSFKSEIISQSENDFVELKVIIDNEYIPDVPKGVRMCTDGFINVRLSEKNILVSEETIPLPTYGIECKGGRAVFDIVFEKYLPGGKHNYNCEIKPERLWVAEI